MTCNKRANTTNQLTIIKNGTVLKKEFGKSLEKSKIKVYETRACSSKHEKPDGDMSESPTNRSNRVDDSIQEKPHSSMK